MLKTLNSDFLDWEDTLIYRYIVIVAKSRGFAVRLTDFWVVSRACDEISWDLAKSSNQFLTLEFL